MNDINVKLLQAEEESEWRNFVKNSNKSSVFNSLKWRDILVHSYKFEPIFLIARQNGRIINGLPLFLVKFPLMGGKIISIPHDGCFGGTIIEDQNNISARLLFKKAIEISKEKEVNYLEIRKLAPSEGLKALNFFEERPFFISQVDLISVKENWKLLTKGHKWSVKYAERSGLKVVIGKGTKDLKSFYSLLSKTFREFGTPVYHFEFIKTIQNMLEKDNMILLLVKKGNFLIGGGIFLQGKDTMIYKWGACDKNYLKFKPYNLLLWNALKLAIEEKKSKINLGITEPSNKGLLAFKNHWGAKSDKLYFYYYPVKTDYPDISKYFSSFQLSKRIWKRLPLPITPIIGKYVHTWFC